MALSKDADMFLHTAQELLDESGRINHAQVANLCHLDELAYYPLLDELERNSFIEFDYMGIGRNHRYEYLKTFVLTEKGRDY